MVATVAVVDAAATEAAAVVVEAAIAVEAANGGSSADESVPYVNRVTLDSADG